MTVVSLCIYEKSAGSCMLKNCFSAPVVVGNFPAIYGKIYDLNVITGMHVSLRFNLESVM